MGATSSDPVAVGVVGCGMIAPTYLLGIGDYESLAVVACADLDGARAQELARQAGTARACAVEELLSDEEVELVVNLTPPSSHAAVNLAAIAAGKHVFSEKPLATSLDDARATLAAASERGVLIGCAPDTFLGAALQTARALIDADAIGAPVAAGAFMLEWGPENWHPDPGFHYGPGLGPMLTMGPYYLTALISLLGPALRVSGSCATTRARRVVVSEPLRGSVIDAQVETHLAGTVDFADGAIASVITSWEAFGGDTLPYLELYGTHGSLSLPDPDHHSGDVKLRRSGEDGWETVALTHDIEARRGIGVADLAHAVRRGQAPRASGELALHAMEIMHAFTSSSAEGLHVELASTCERPAPLPPGLAHGVLDHTL